MSSKQISIEQAAIEPSFDLLAPGGSLDALYGSELPITAPRLDGLRTGTVTSRMLGEGSDMDGIKPYEVGDNVRHINWRATARDPFDRIQVQRFYADQSPRVVLVSDIAHNRFDSHGELTSTEPFTKQQLGVSALMGFAAVASNQRMNHAAIVSTGDQIIDTGFGRGDDHDYDIAQSLTEAIKADRDSDEQGRFAKLINYAAETITDRSVVIVVSDFLDVADPNDSHYGWVDTLRGLREDGHSIITTTISAPSDTKLSVKQAKKLLVDSHTPRWLGSNRVSKNVVAAYARNEAAKQVVISSVLGEVAATHLGLSTENPYWRTDLQSQLQAAR